MSYLDKTFCASPRCNNDCGRRMTDEERERLTYSQAQYVSYGYFCGEQDKPIKRLKSVHNPIDLTPLLSEGMAIFDGIQELAIDKSKLHMDVVLKNGTKFKSTSFTLVSGGSGVTRINE